MIDFDALEEAESKVRAKEPTACVDVIVFVDGSRPYIVSEDFVAVRDAPEIPQRPDGVSAGALQGVASLRSRGEILLVDAMLATENAGNDGDGTWFRLARVDGLLFNAGMVGEGNSDTSSGGSSWVLARGDEVGSPGVRFLRPVAGAIAPASTSAELHLWSLAIRLAYSSRAVFLPREKCVTGHIAAEWLKSAGGCVGIECTGTATLPAVCCAVLGGTGGSVEARRSTGARKTASLTGPWRTFASHFLCQGDVVERCPLLWLPPGHDISVRRLHKRLVCSHSDLQAPRHALPLGFGVLYRHAFVGEQENLACVACEEELRLVTIRSISLGEELVVPVGGISQRVQLRENAGAFGCSLSATHVFNILRKSVLEGHLADIVSFDSLLPKVVVGPSKKVPGGRGVFALRNVRSGDVLEL